MRIGIDNAVSNNVLIMTRFPARNASSITEYHPIKFARPEKQEDSENRQRPVRGRCGSTLPSETHLKRQHGACPDSPMNSNTCSRSMRLGQMRAGTRTCLSQGIILPIHCVFFELKLNMLPAASYTSLASMLFLQFSGRQGSLKLLSIDSLLASATSSGVCCHSAPAIAIPPTAVPED